jgi:hypothetical protein
MQIGRLLAAGALFFAAVASAAPAPVSHGSESSSYDLKKSAPVYHSPSGHSGPSTSTPPRPSGASSSYERNRAVHVPPPQQPHPATQLHAPASPFNAHPVSPAIQQRAPVANTYRSPASVNSPRATPASMPQPVSRPVNFYRSEQRPAPARSNGARPEIHDIHRGLDIHYGVNGSRRVVMERSDHSRVFAERSGGYVQHPYVFHGQEFAHRTYVEHGHEVVRFYDRHVYHGVPLEVYAPVRFYPVGFYGWVYQPWSTPVRYTWEWRTRPWYRAYGYYFVPYPVYADASLWLTDYLIASSLEAAYAAQVRAQMDRNGSTGLSAEQKEEIADEVRLEIQQEQAAAQANARDPRGGPEYGGIGEVLTDGHSHVFIAGSTLDVVDGSGDDCVLSQGDVVRVRAAPAPGAQAVNATVVASKGGDECAPDGTVRIAIADLQEMQNHMRETLDQGMEQLQSRQGAGNLPAAPAGALSAPVAAGFTQGAPAADPNAQLEIAQQASAADMAEKESAANSQ